MRTPDTDLSEQLATTSEVARALAVLKPVDLKRLELIARGRSSGLAAMDWRDLLQESIARSLEASRRWPKNIPIVSFLAQTMRSIASEARRRQVSESSAYSLDDGSTACSASNEIASEYLEILRKRFEGDADVIELMAGLMDGETAKETQVRTSMTSTKYDAARKRFWRGVSALAEN